MAVYFLPKSRLIQKVGNFRPKQWTPKWNKSSAVLTRTSSNSSFSGGGGGSRVGWEKGKCYKTRRWTWKAGAGWTILSVLDWWLLAAGSWLSWRGVFLRFTPIGLCLIAAANWHLHNHCGSDMDRKGLPRAVTRWQVSVYRLLPLRLASRCFGLIASLSLPELARPIIYGLYSSTFGVNIEEAADSNYRHYRSLAEFFTRSLKDQVRLIDHQSCIVSPCDGRVLHIGTATNEQIEQVKGVSYSLRDFLGPSWSTESTMTSNYIDSIKLNPKSTLYQCIIYLAPGDYHRFHSPTRFQPRLRRHFAGELLSVNPKFANCVPGLFTLNERAVYIGQWEFGFFSFTAVGATNVGSVQVYFDEALKTNRWLGLKVGKNKYQRHYNELKLAENIELEKGELIGQFNMGSTIVLVFEAPKDFEFNLAPGQPIKLGERLGHLARNDQYHIRV